MVQVLILDIMELKKKENGQMENQLNGINKEFECQLFDNILLITLSL